MKKKIYTSLNLPVFLKMKLQMCVQKLNSNETDLLSVLCYKAGKFVCKETKYLQTIDYQERGADYEITPVWFFASDHEYMHSCRLACKVSVSKLLASAMALFLDEIMEKGINQLEIAQLRIKKNSYRKKSYFMRNIMFKITKNDQFQEYEMKLRMTKT